MTAWLDAKVGFFPNCRCKDGGQNLPLAEVLEGIRSGQWAKPVGELRQMPAKSGAYKAAKRRLPCFMLSGTTTGGHKGGDLGQHSGLLQLDVDEAGEREAAALRDQLAADPHVLAAWISPGGAGVKGAFRIPADTTRHKESFRQAQEYLASRFQVTIDPQCSDPSRLCFVSFDPDLRMNPEAVPLPPTAEPLPPAGGRFGKGEARLPENSSSSLHSASASCILHNKAELFQAFPDLLPLFNMHVKGRLGIPARGLRNAALVELVAGTFCVVHPRYVRAFAEVFHQEHPDIFTDYPRAQWLGEAESLLTGCLDDYPQKNLGPEELALYANLPDDLHTATFRICRSLARCESDPLVPPPEFYLSAHQLATRLGVLDMQAWRIMKALQRCGVAKTVATGTRRAAGQKAVATRYRWCYPLNSEP